MSEHVCPWWIGYLLASPLRRLLYKPEQILGSHIREGMTVLEPGCAMGFFSLLVLAMVSMGAGRGKNTSATAAILAPPAARATDQGTTGVDPHAPAWQMPTVH